MDKAVADLREQVTQLTLLVQNQQNRFNQRPFIQSRPPNKPETRSRNSCSRKGHIARDCRSRTILSNNRNPRYGAQTGNGLNVPSQVFVPNNVRTFPVPNYQNLNRNNLANVSLPNQVTTNMVPQFYTEQFTTGDQGINFRNNDEWQQATEHSAK